MKTSVTLEQPTAMDLRDVKTRMSREAGQVLALDVVVARLVAHWSATQPPAGERPRIVCLCGSTRFGAVFAEQNLRLTLAGEIVLSIGCDTKTDGELAAAGALGRNAERVKADLDALHRHKIALADYVLVVSDETGYFGESTAGEIHYAITYGKPVKWLHPAAQERWSALIRAAAQ